MVQEKKVYVCEICDAAFYDRKKAEKHEQIPVQGKILEPGLVYRDEFDHMRVILTTPVIYEEHVRVYASAYIINDEGIYISPQSDFVGFLMGGPSMQTRAEVLKKIPDRGFEKIKRDLTKHYSRKGRSTIDAVMEKMMKEIDTTPKEFCRKLTNSIPRRYLA